MPADAGDSSPDSGSPPPAAEPHHESFEFDVRSPSGDAGRESARQRYGRLQGYFRTRADEFAALQQDLAEAGISTTVDAYLARTVQYIAVAAGAGAALAVAVAFLFALPWWTPLVLGPVGALIGGSTAAAVRRYYPRVIAHRRRRAIDRALPDATLFLFALTRGGMDLYEVIQRLGKAQARYGALADEFDRIVLDTRTLGVDLYTAITRARETTPSEDFEAFLDELVSVLETGGDVENFLEDQVDVQRERAEERQERLLDDLATVAEAYVVLVFAGPLFLLIILVVASFARPELVAALGALVYAGIPLAIAGFGVVFSTWFGPPALAVTADAERGSEADREPPDDERADAYERTRRTEHLRERLAAPVDLLRRRPALAFAVSVPLAAAIVAGFVLAGVVTPTVEAFLRGDPVRSTTVLVAVPLLVALAPFALFDEREHRRRRELSERFPTVLEIVGDAVGNDVPLGDCFKLVARRVSGTLGEEMSRIHHDIQWNDDVEGALSRFAGRVRVPAVSRIVGLLTSCLRSTSSLEPVFETVADDLERRNRVRRRRRREVRPYLIVVFLGVLVYLGVVVMFDRHFLPVVSEVARQAGDTPTPIDLSTVDPGVYRRLFYHSVLIQAVGNGLVLGLLTENRLQGGVKYAVFLIALVAVAFTVFV